MSPRDAGGSGNTGHTTAKGERRRLLTAAEAGYRKDMGISTHRCGECLFYVNGKCEKVRVDPNADGVCNEFEPGGFGRLNSHDPGVGTKVATFKDEGNMDKLIGLELIITKVAEDKQTGIKRWFARASGIERDLFNERMSVSLFKDFIKRAEGKEEVPAPFSSKAWNGGLPYLGVAHYLDLDGFGIAGTTDQIFIDGHYFKAKGVFKSTSLGDKSYEAIKRDIEENVPHDKRVRVSIAFIDWGHEHEGHGAFRRESLIDRCDHCENGIGEKIYTNGHLVHLALTRRPAYPQATIELEERSMSKRRDDAASIVEDELADELEAKTAESLVGRTEDIDPSAVVIKAEDENLGEEEQAEVDVTEAPYGGSLTIEQAEEFLVQKASDAVLMDSWGVLHGVLTNIAGSEHSEAIGSQLKTFQSKIDIKAIEALDTLAKRGDTMSEKEVLVERQPPAEGKEPVEEEEEGMTTGTAEEEEGATEEDFTFKSTSEAGKPHPLDQSFLALRNAFDEAVATPVDEGSRLQMIQPALNEIGAAIQLSIKAAPSESGVSEDIIKRAVDEAVAPLQAKLAALESQVSSKDSPESVIPGRRAVSAAPLVQRIEVDAPVKQEPTEDNPTPGLRAIARRSTGLRY